MPDPIASGPNPTDPLDSDAITLTYFSQTNTPLSGTTVDWGENPLVITKWVKDNANTISSTSSSVDRRFTLEFSTGGVIVDWNLLQRKSINCCYYMEI